ncbi:MAG: MBL fold metallo-hydrolase [Saprospiraceae bacterium]|uniref:MBL fold metallo-hydrolase n=1 Tax=Candidatus Opimibacter skivensis TaxID=2982028 RepID=A0A9D7SRC6_9BACT|nr:MBL fold metallo-hydrolase [Candidatus Opimibacter skivensis]
MNSLLEITLLGTGTSQGIPVIGCPCPVCASLDQRDKRFRTAAFIQAGETGLAIDLGPDFRLQMLNNGISDVHAVLLTHEHNDHISGLDDIRPINFRYNRNIPIFGSERSLAEIRNRFLYAFDPEYMYPGKPHVTAMVINDDPFMFNDVLVTPIPVDHGDMPIYGYRIGDLAYITDAKIVPARSKALLQNLDTLILNALRIEPHIAHLNIEEAIEIVKELKPRRCFLTHISHDSGLHADIDKILPEGIRLGYDGLRIRIQ